MSENSPAAPSRRVLEVRVSAAADMVPTLRTLAADIAMRQDFDLDAVDDLRMAVDEACSLLIPAASGDQLTCVFTAELGRVEVSVSVLTHRPDLAGENALGWQLLSALTTSLRRTVTPADEGYVSRVELVRECAAVAR